MSWCWTVIIEGWLKANLNVAEWPCRGAVPKLAIEDYQPKGGKLTTLDVWVKQCPHVRLKGSQFDS